MRLKTRVIAEVNPDVLRRGCSRAEHAVAVQAERDTRRYIPGKRIRSSGKVYDNSIVWTGENVRLFYFGNVYVDPKRKIAGFPVGDGAWRSFKGRKKIKSDRKFNFRQGTSQWWSAAKKDHLTQWILLAKGVIESGK